MRWLIGLAVVLVVLAGMVVAALANLAPLIAWRASAAMSREVTVGAAWLVPGRWLRIELRDVAVANLQGGTRLSMLTLAGATAEVDALSLLHGPAVLRRLVIDRLDLLLERVGPDRRRNWRTGPAGDPNDDGRRTFPVLLDATVTGAVTFRTFSGNALVTTVEGMRIEAASAQAPVKIAGPGSYRGVPILLDADLGSFDQLHDAATAFPADIQMASGDTKLRFKGTMMRPLDVDGATGRLALAAPKPDVIEAVSGVEPTPAPPLQIEGDLTRNRDDWHLVHAVGALGGSRFADSELRLVEGSSEQKRPDEVTAAFTFEALDLDALLADAKGGSSPGSGSGSGDADIPIAISRNPATLLDVRLAAKTATYHHAKLLEPALAASLTPGKVAVEAFGFGYLGGKLRASGRIETTEADAGTGHVAAEVEADGVNVQELVRALQAGAVPVQGRLATRVTVEASGATLNAAAARSHIGMVAAMQGGSIAEEVIEAASTDARALFRTAKGNTPITCMLAIVDVRNGVGAVTPVRVRAGTGTVVGRGSFDLNRRTLDLTIASESRTTSSFALDVPIRLSGPFANPSAGPAQLSATGRGELGAADSVGRLTPALRDYARRSPCLERAR